MRCPTCKAEAVRANPDDDMGAEWFMCVNPTCTQRAWPRGERNPKRERAAVVENLVSLTEEQRERRAAIYIGRLR
jgi:hypothetical protein